MAVGDFYRVSVLGFRGNSAIRNQYTYRSISAECTASELCDAFRNSVNDSFLDCVSDIYGMEQIYVENLNSITDFIQYQYASPQAGHRSGPYCNDVISVAFQAPSKVRGIRAGAKRVGPLSLSMVNANAVTASTVESARLAAYASAISADLSNSTPVAIAEPVVIKRIYLGLVNGKRSYALPKFSTATNHYVADNWGYKQVLTTQVSRKSGRGE